jgi:hypothetical protein
VAAQSGRPGNQRGPPDRPSARPAEIVMVGVAQVEEAVSLSQEAPNGKNEEEEEEEEEEDNLPVPAAAAAAVSMPYPPITKVPILAAA